MRNWSSQRIQCSHSENVPFHTVTLPYSGQNCPGYGSFKSAVDTPLLENFTKIFNRFCEGRSETDRKLWKREFSKSVGLGGGPTTPLSRGPGIWGA